MGLFNSLLYKVSDWQVRHPFAVLGIIFAITIIFAGGVSSVQTVASIEKMMPESSPEVHYFNVLRDEFKGKDSLAVIIEIDDESLVKGESSISSYRMAEYARDIQEVIDSNSKITSTRSISDYLILQNYKQYGEHGFPSKERYEKIKKTEEFQEIKNAFIDHSKKTSLVMATTDVGTIDSEMNKLATHLKAQVDDFGHPPGIKVSVTGSPVLQQRLAQLISVDKYVTFSIAAVFIFITLLLLFRSLFSSLAPLLMVVLAAFWLYGTMGYFNLPISTLAGSVASIVMGLGIDYSIHVLHRYSHERKEGKLIREAADLAVVNTGTAVIATTATTLAAFFAFLFGQMPEMGRFGLLLIIGISYAMLLSLFGLPAMLVVEEKIKYKLKRMGGGSNE